MQKLAEIPHAATAFVASGPVGLQRSGDRWHAAGNQSGAIELTMTRGAGGMAIGLRAPGVELLRIHLRWQLRVLPDWQYLGDHWERSYGDLGWRTLDPERVLPWYVLTYDGRSSGGFGVKTGPAAFCFWQIDAAGVSLWLDVRNGGRGVVLTDREVTLATVCAAWYPETRPFPAACRFCRLLCDKPRLPAQPVYGGNNWYYSYGKSSAEAIRGDSERMASLASSASNRPFMVIDDGWSLNATAGPWLQGNPLFPDMALLASDMKKRGVQPGLWIRPLFTKQAVPEGWRLNSPNAAKEYRARQAYTLDPTVPEAAASIAADMRNAVGWGYQLVKHDFSTYDLLGRWGFRMGAELTDGGWSFTDRSRTNAETVRAFYGLLRDAAGDKLLLGCNTVGHLSAGLFELSRTGDDTSGRDWDRTRRMGVNTLAFRGPQHDAFFAIDADCVGLTNKIPWQLNRQWLDLLARSGTPLFVSAAPDALGAEQRQAIERAFSVAAKPQPLIEPTDWLTTTEPERWRAGDEDLSYDWFGNGGAAPVLPGE